MYIVCQCMQLQCVYVSVCELQAVSEYYEMYQTRKMADGSLSLSIDFVVIDCAGVVACC